MRLSDDKARRLSRLVWRDRAKRALPFVLAIAALFAALVYFTEISVDHIDRTVDVQVRSGTVVDAKLTAGRSVIVRVHLEDGRDVEALGAGRIAPQAGTQVLINEARHASGRSTYEIARIIQ